jgi:hypothetical protein
MLTPAEAEALAGALAVARCRQHLAAVTIRG